MINTRQAISSIIILGMLSFIFLLYPSLDIFVSNLFYDTKDGFIYKNHGLALFIFRFIPYLAWFCIFIFVILIVFSMYRPIGNKNLRSNMIFLLICAIIGPGITVNAILKENSGRARPCQIEEFGGDKKFSPVFTFSDQCNTNCSFPSGHAAMGFYFSSIAYIVGASYFSRVYFSTLIFGFAVGASRIVMGGHFISDVLSSAFIVLSLNNLLYFLWQKIKN